MLYFFFYKAAYPSTGRCYWWRRCSRYRRCGGRKYCDYRYGKTGICCSICTYIIMITLLVSFFNENGLYSSVSILIDSLKLTVKFGKYELINHELANLWIWSWKIVISLVLCIPLRRLGGQNNSPNFTKLAEIFCFRRTSWRWSRLWRYRTYRTKINTPLSRGIPGTNLVVVANKTNTNQMGTINGLDWTFIKKRIFHTSYINRLY